MTSLRRWLDRCGGKLRLPSETEWEYACRATAKTAFPWGAAPDIDRVWCRERDVDAPRPAKSHRELGNAFGLVDMLGNVWEWCEASPGSNYAPRTPHLNAAHILKGGSFRCPAERCRVETRDFGSPHQVDDETGFRVCRSLPEL